MRMASSDALEEREGVFELRIGAIDGGEVARAKKQYIMIIVKVKRPLMVMENMFAWED